jgi:uncharacterized protein (DUF1684 family)
MQIIYASSFAQTYQQEIAAYREKYKKEFLESERSPIKNKEDLEFIRFYDVDESFKLTATFSKTENAQPFDLPTMNGKTKSYIEYGSLSFSLHGKNLSLKIYQSILLLEKSEYKNHLFLPFLDETNGHDTYGGGRYLDFETSDIKDNRVVIDFNKAYNPYCAFADGYSCPKPPEENYLRLEIKAGEKSFAKSTH